MSARVAVAQVGTKLYDTPATLQLLFQTTKKAASKGAQLILFPEAFVGGYPKELDFGVVLGLRSNEGREEFARYFSASISADGDESKQIGECAKENGIFIVTGVVERDGSTLYCSVFYYNALGELYAKHRKLMPTALERVVWGQGDGSTMPVVNSPIGKIGSAICWENYMPLYRMALYSKGMEVLLAPTVDSRDEWLATMRTIALEGRCFVVSACQFLQAKDFPSDHQQRINHKDDDILIRGGSCVIDPLGKVLLTPNFSSTSLSIIDLDLSIIPKARFDLDPIRHYSRPDVFRLIVDETPKNTVARINKSFDQ